MTSRTRRRPISACRTLSFTLAVMLVSMSSLAQQGQNAVMDSTNHPQKSPSFFDATQFVSAGDPCQAIAAAFVALPTTGGTVDARGLTTGSALVCWQSTAAVRARPSAPDPRGWRLAGQPTLRPIARRQIVRAVLVPAGPLPLAGSARDQAL
jgi:hypothetical protein